MRLIDADALPVKFDGHIVAVWKNDIDNAPTVDAVEVVRCKDCRHCVYDEIIDEMWCDGKRVSKDWFCAKGAKMNEAKDEMAVTYYSDNKPVETIASVNKIAEYVVQKVKEQERRQILD